MSWQRLKLIIRVYLRRLGDRIAKVRTDRYWAGVRKENDLIRDILFKEGLLRSVSWDFVWQGTEWCRLVPGFSWCVQEDMGSLLSLVYAGEVKLGDEISFRCSLGGGTHIKFRHPDDLIAFVETHRLRVNWENLVSTERAAREAAEEWYYRRIRAEATQKGLDHG